MTAYNGGIMRVSKHGHAAGKCTPEYRSWKGMKARCNNKNNKRYSDYGGRGIKVCERWNDSFLHFIEDMGLKISPEYSIDRIDNNGDYTKSNCRWATRIEQLNNTRKNKYLLFKGKIKTIPQWARIVKINKSTIFNRIYALGWSIEKSLTFKEICQCNNTIQLSLSGDYISTYRSISEASRHTGIARAGISSCCNGRLKTSGGFLWKLVKNKKE